MDGGSSTDAEVLVALGEDPRLARLEGYVSPLSLFRVLDVARDEKRHSRLLAALLDPLQHRGAEVMLRVLLGRVLASGRIERGFAERLEEIASVPWDRVLVSRELFAIDLVVEIFSSRGDAVMGIENKIDAGEEQKQIARYQDVLRRAFSGRTAFVAFLTPTGRGPATARSDILVPAVPVGYEAVLGAVEEAGRRAPLGSREERVLGEVAAHLKEDIVGDPEAKTLVRELWRTHGRALELALRQRPRLDDVRDHYVGLLKERFGSDIEPYYWPERRGNLRSIAMDLPRWFERGFPLTFMLHASEWGRPRVRVLVWEDNYKKHARRLRQWADRINAETEPIVDENFTPIRHWGGWRKVLREEDDPSSAVVDQMVFDEDTAKAAVEAVSALVERLRPHVEGP